MRKWRSLWRGSLSPQICEELETWVGVLLGVAALLLLYSTLTAQAVGSVP
jgi:hypothetical protein